MTTATDPILDRLGRLHPKTIDLSLGRVRRLLAALGNPERRLPPVVHIAGTNGKGSTLAMLAAMLEADGRVAHRYVSPHLIRFNERILLAGNPIADADLETLLLEVERANGDAPITFFEITTAAAFLAFARTPADVVLLETGLGGRLDATNVVPLSRLTLLSPLSFDHEAFLGRTLTAIAREKCGILRSGVEAISAPQPPAATMTICQWATRIGAPLRLHGRDYHTSRAGDGFVFEDAAGRLALPSPSLPGAHQIDNAGLAVAAARRLGEARPSAAAIAQGLRITRWQARLQRIEAGALRQLVRHCDELWIDGAHNPQGARVAAAFFADQPARPLRLVMGVLTTKDVDGCLEPLVALADELIAVPVPGSEAAMPAAELAARAAAYGVRASTAEDVAGALARLAHGEAARIVVTGSLYLAGDALERNAGTGPR